MSDKLEIKNESTEPITTHISVPCTKTDAGRYKKIGERLEKLQKKKLLTRKARTVLLPILTEFEQALDELDRGA